MRACRVAALLLGVAAPTAALKGSRIEASKSTRVQTAAELEALVNADLQVFYQGRVLLGQGTEVDSEIESGDMPTVTLSPQQRAAQHSIKFEKEFTVDLDMTLARDKGLTVGVVLDMDTDFQPVSIMTIRKTGLIEAWNKANPDRAVLVGDEIMKVNDILWHHNSKTFAERIRGQFLASRGQIKGAKNILSLSIQRPRQERHTRFQTQREDLHRKLYSKEFVAEVPFTGVLPRDPLHQAMGWKLNTTVDWAPVSIEKLRTSGLVANYNKEHPESRIQAGDEILEVNGVKWHHNATLFEDRIHAQFLTGQKAEFINAPGVRNVLELRVRRPRSARDMPATQSYVKQFVVDLRLKDQHPLGWSLNATSDADPLAVAKVQRNSPLGRFNKKKPADAVKAGDLVMRVNNVVWHRNSQKFLERIGKEFAQARPHKDKASGQPLTLTMQRRLVQPITKEWTVTLPAVEGKALGWRLTSECDEFPLTVDKVRAMGVVPEFNQNNMVNRIQSGDVIVKVNDRLWRQDSTEFEKHLNELYSKSKRWGNITLFLRRPAAPEGSDNEGPESRPFEREFLVELPITGQPLGWQLQSDNVTAPVSVAKVRNVGAVGAWNAANPLLNIQVGDLLARVNNVIWHGNSTTFMDRMNTQVLAARKGKRSITVLVQRPWFTTTADGDSSTSGDEKLGEDGVVGGAED